MKGWKIFYEKKKVVILKSFLKDIVETWTILMLTKK